MVALLNVIDIVVEIVMQLAQITALEHAKDVRAIAVAIVSVIAMKHVKVVVRNHVVEVVLILVQEAQNNRGNRKPYRVGNTLKCHSI